MKRRANTSKGAPDAQAAAALLVRYALISPEPAAATRALLRPATAVT